MRWDKFTVMSQEALRAAQAKAEEEGQQEVRPEHLLWSFLQQDENLVNAVLAKVGADSRKIREDLEAALAGFPKVTGGGEPFLSKELNRILGSAEKEAGRLKDEFVSTEHALLAMLKDVVSQVTEE